MAKILKFPKNPRREYVKRRGQHKKLQNRMEFWAQVLLSILVIMAIGLIFTSFWMF